ncbi:MAG: CoA transferase subunit A [Candidatus Muiribacteriota bacterium]
MKEILKADEAVKKIKSGSSIMIGGFMCCGQPFDLVESLLQSEVDNLTIICNDAGYPGLGVGKLICAGRVKKLIATHIGLNPEAGKKMNNGEMEVVLVPQGTLAERIRAGGAGLGGILTPTGIGTRVEEGKKIIEVDGKKYLLEKALKADYSFVKANVCDVAGNGFTAKSAKNFNLIMSMAGKHSFLETEELVGIGEIGPEDVVIPGVFINTVVEGKYEYR